MVQTNRGSLYKKLLPCISCQYLSQSFIDREQEKGLFIVQTSIYRYELRQRRKPMEFHLLPGVLLLRYATRLYVGAASQAPPRNTRNRLA